MTPSKPMLLRRPPRARVELLAHVGRPSNFLDNPIALEALEDVLYVGESVLVAQRNQKLRRLRADCLVLCHGHLDRNRTSFVGTFADPIVERWIDPVDDGIVRFDPLRMFDTRSRVSALSSRRSSKVASTLKRLYNEPSCFTRQTSSGFERLQSTGTFVLHLAGVPLMGVPPRNRSREPRSSRGQLQEMLSRAREFHEQVEALELSRGTIFANIRARLHWHPQSPPLPPGHATHVDQIVELFEDQQLSPWQASELELAFVFGE